MSDANSPLAPSRIGEHEKLRKAVAARAAGMTWAKVAQASGYFDGPTALRAVRKYLADTANSDDAKTARALEETRLDELQARWWIAARTDLKAAEYVLRVIDRRIKLKGLDVNEGRMASAAEAQAMAEMASAIGLQASLIWAMTEAGVDPDQQDRVIELLNARIQPAEGDIEGEVAE